MRRQTTLLVLVTLLLLVPSCKKSIPEDAADAILKELATELVGMEGSSAAKKLETVTSICKRHETDPEALSAYLKEHPNAEEKLVGFMSEAFVKEMDELNRGYEAQLAKIKEARQQALDKVSKSGEEKKREVEVAHATRAGEVKKDFEARKKALLAELKKIKEMP